MLHYLVLFVIAFIASTVSIFIVLRLSQHFGLYDTVDARKVHTGNIPRLGGVGMFLGFLLSLIMFALDQSIDNTLGTGVWNLIGSCALIFIMGVCDDMKAWRARYKLFIQIAATLLVIVAGFTFHTISFPALGIHWNMGILRFPITFCWIIGVTNAVNLIDGIDGLAGSVSAMSALIFAFFFYQYGNTAGMVICLILAVSIGGFLVFNLPLPRAKIFMGDGGSQFLGYMLAVLPLMPNGKGGASISLPIAAAVLMIPIFDTFAALWRRSREHRSFFDPDKFHLHHKLMMLGFSAPQALVILILLQSIIGLLVITADHTKGLTSVILLVTVYLLGSLFFTVVHIRKEELIEKSKMIED